MIGTKAVILILSAGFIPAAIGVAIPQTNDLNTIEKYGILGLHTVMVLSMLKIGWEMTKTFRDVTVVLAELKIQNASDRKNMDDKFDDLKDAITGEKE